MPSSIHPTIRGQPKHCLVCFVYRAPVGRVHERPKHPTCVAFAVAPFTEESTRLR